MNITIARIRSNVTYTGPLETVLDSFFENYVKWMNDNSQHNFKTYNVSFGDGRPQRTPETIDWADVIVIPSDSEFRYHGELQMNPKDLAKSEVHMKNIRPFFENKIVILFRSDRGDTEELYRNETLKDVNLKSFHIIDEIDFSGNIHGMKYHFIQNLQKKILFLSEKTIDFGYWGKMKPSEKNERENTIRKIYKDEDISSIMIGGFPSGVIRQSKWIKDWKKLFPMIEPSRTTLCFNWKDPTATTSRYPEALSVGIIPFVWKDYDIHNTYKIDDWQRVKTFEEFKDKILHLRDENLFKDKLKQYINNYKKVLLSEDEYYKQFSNMMNRILS
jgi:hypothetical protein|tara:strand:+ start:1301 stop:2293 length:993 start_codon:yes stop_codon:yes gene_type:complete